MVDACVPCGLYVATGTVDRRPLPALYSGGVQYDFFRVLRDCVGISAALTTLSITGVPISIALARLLAKALAGQPHPQLHTVQLVRCGLENADVGQLCGGLRHCPALLTLDLSHNSITASGVESLAVLLNVCAHTVFLLKNYKLKLQLEWGGEAQPRT